MSPPTPRPTTATDPNAKPGNPESQSASAVLMVCPAAFGWNPETAGSNAFQDARARQPGPESEAARGEFEGVVRYLRGAGVTVFALDEPGPNACPDAVFPNNWVTLHHDGTVVLYPMLAPSRRLERRTELLAQLEQLGGYRVTRLLDLSHHERSGRYLEGTGSVVFDHVGRVAYACRSPRTDESVLRELCDELAYTPVAFDATDSEGVPIYHTNVLLSVGTRYAIACADSIAAADRAAVMGRLQSGRRHVIRIDRRQMSNFSGNALELAGDAGLVLTLSERAWQAFDPAAQETLRRSVTRIVAAPVPTIETRGGGSVRCMLAEVFLPRAAAPSGSG